MKTTPFCGISGLFIFSIAFALLSFTASAQEPATDTSSCTSGTPVLMADQTWESAAFTTQFIRLILTHGYGCSVEIIPGATAATESALVQNDIHIIAEQWTGRSRIMEQGIEQGQVQIVGDTLKGGAEQGWYVPDYLVHGDSQRGIQALAPDLHSWRDLPRYKSLFSDPEQPQKGRFLNCPSGWVCEQTNSRLLEIHSLLGDYTNFRAGTGAALDTAISAAYEKGEPILFYYWQPAGLMAKYKFSKIEQDPFNARCWESIVSGEGDLCSSDFLRAHLGVAASTSFAEQHPDIINFFKKLQFEPQELNQIILRMNEERSSSTDLTKEFLLAHPQRWQTWLAPAQVNNLNNWLEQQKIKTANKNSKEIRNNSSDSHTETKTRSFFFPDWSLAQQVNQQLQSWVQTYGTRFRQFSNALLTTVLLPVERTLELAPAWALIALTGLLAWHATRTWWSALLYMAGLYLIGAAGLWSKLIQTFALVAVATLLCVIIGLPLGILAARWRSLRQVLTPVMDVMQTLPSFVYLIPVLMLFGLGKVPALFATIIYAVPPLIRLTTLGLNQVDHTITEAAQSFGVTRWQMLTRVTLPLARPTIMAGINQATMMALAMVVVASMIGARGLGEDVLAGIQTLDVGRGLQAGIAIVILAIVIDRITQAYGRAKRSKRRPTTALPLANETSQETPNNTPVKQEKLQIKNVYKVFGGQESQALTLLRKGQAKTQVQEQTGSNVGLAGISLDIPAGQITCIMGLSGSGKSTLVRHLNRLIDPSAGEILLNGQNILNLSMAKLRHLRRYSISMVFQHFGLLPHLNVIQNVAFGLIVRGEPKQQAQQKAALWLDRVGLGSYAWHYPDELSGGMRQRVGLARALAIDAGILLMDEAFSALDPLIRYEMQDQLLSLQERLQKTIVFITHDIDEALRLGQYIVILRDGKIEQAGSPEAIRQTPANEYIRRFIQQR